MFHKVMVANRGAVAARVLRALRAPATAVIAFVRQVLQSPEFIAGDVHTGLGADVLARAKAARAQAAAESNP